MSAGAAATRSVPVPAYVMRQILPSMSSETYSAPSGANNVCHGL
jgi:hypothetical protein